MGSFLQQLGVDSTFFTQLGLFVALFIVLSQIFFKPFLRLFENRHQKMVADREAAERLMAQAEEKFSEYHKRLNDAHLQARKEYDAALNEAKHQEAELLSRAREEVKKITQDAATQVAQQREALKRDLELEVESLAVHVTQKLLGSGTNGKQEGPG